LAALTLSLGETVRAKGIVLSQGSERYILCALDWFENADESQWRRPSFTVET
jgi:hypothetical protein